MWSSKYEGLPADALHLVELLSACGGWQYLLKHHCSSPAGLVFIGKLLLLKQLCSLQATWTMRVYLLTLLHAGKVSIQHFCLHHCMRRRSNQLPCSNWSMCLDACRFVQTSNPCSAEGGKYAL